VNSGLEGTAEKVNVVNLNLLSWSSPEKAQENKILGQNSMATVEESYGHFRFNTLDSIEEKYKIQKNFKTLRIVYAPLKKAMKT
jgi:hypothetical protein